MAIQLYFSNRLEQLAEKLAESVYSDRGNSDIFRQPVIIVPNANLIKWLQLFFAKTRLIAMNIAFCYLEDGMRKLIQELDPAQKKPETADKKLSQIILLYILQHSESDMPSIFHQYLRKDRADYAGRVWQLSDRLAALFQEYEFNRPEMIRGWLAGKVGLGSEMEACQQKLYLRINELTERLSRHTGKSFFSLINLVYRLCTTSLIEAKSSGPVTVLMLKWRYSLLAGFPFLKHTMAATGWLPCRLELSKHSMCKGRCWS